MMLVVAMLIGWFWYTRGQTSPILPDERFELQFGRGSGWDGLDLLRVTSDGKASYEYQTDAGEWNRKTFVIDETALAGLRKAINELNPWAMKRAYHGGAMDGTQWVLMVRIEGKVISVYFDNQFPSAIRRFAHTVDWLCYPFAKNRLNA